MPRGRERRRGKAPNYRRRAKRDVGAAFQGQFDELDRAESGAERDAEQYGQQVGNIYSGLSGELSALGPQYQSQVAGISEGLEGSLGRLVGMLPGGMPAAEGAAGSAMFGGIGGAGLAQLASQAARGVGYNTSALRQAEIDAANYQTSVLQELDDFKKALGEQRMDLTGQMAPLVLSRIDELRQKAQELALANREFKLRKFATTEQLGLDQKRFRSENRSNRALSEFTMEQILDALRKVRRGGGGEFSAEQLKEALNNLVR